MVLGRKYRLLRIAYNVFMFGIIASVLAFVIASAIVAFKNTNDRIYLFNRDLSWLSFNERVLMEAENEQVLYWSASGFWSIYSSNLMNFTG
ncbi:hypothetical protein CS542_10000 [Pedobacter sp. IW39]|nr:hypothetical protein CS542_10000 [Pedobacter sp. IW39]